MDIEKTLRQFQKEVNRRLVDFFQQKIKKFKKLSPVTGEMVEEIRNFTMRDGKRIRPLFVYYGYLATGGKNKKAILDVCIFAELIHSYLLIHDDIIDRDKIRRGELTLHCRYSKDYRKLSNDADFLGICAGILAGDLTSTFSYEILADSNFLMELKNKAIKRLNQILEDVINGQILDIFLKVGRKLNKEDIFKILEYKTARYTIEGPLQIGAILAGAGSKTLQILSQYAIPLGMAFQIKDDILGMFGDSKITGKTIDSDIKEGKQTLLILEARQRTDAKQKKIIAGTLGNINATKKQIQELKKIVRETGSLDYSLREAKKLVNRAKIVIEKSNFSLEVKQFLIGIADYIIQREK